MPLTQADLTMYQGCDYAGSVTITVEDLPADLSGYTAKAQIRRAVADAEPVIAAEMSTTIASPKVYLSLSNDQTQTMNGRYVWDLKLIGSPEVVIPVMKGKVTVTPEVTRLP